MEVKRMKEKFEMIISSKRRKERRRNKRKGNKIKTEQVQRYIWKLKQKRKTGYTYGKR